METEREWQGLEEVPKIGCLWQYIRRSMLRLRAFFWATVFIRVEPSTWEGLLTWGDRRDKLLYHMLLYIEWDTTIPSKASRHYDQTVWADSQTRRFAQRMQQQWAHDTELRSLHKAWAYSRGSQQAYCNVFPRCADHFNEHTADWNRWHLIGLWCVVWEIKLAKSQATLE